MQSLRCFSSTDEEDSEIDRRTGPSGTRLATGAEDHRSALPPALFLLNFRSNPSHLKSGILEG